MLQILVWNTNCYLPSVNTKPVGLETAVSLSTFTSTDKFTSRGKGWGRHHHQAAAHLTKIEI